MTTYLSLPLLVLVAAADAGVCVCDCRPDLGIRIVCEQVSHHPPVSAFHVESDLIVFHGAVHPKIKFWGKSIDITPKGVVTLVLKRYLFSVYCCWFV